MTNADRYFPAGDVRLRYCDEGEGDAVVLVHGWTLDLEAWEPQSAEFSRTLRVVRLDRRGFGLSAGVPDAARDADDLGALLDHLKIARAALVGASQGGRPALAFALRHPQRVASLVLDGPPDLAQAAGTTGDISFAEFRAMARGQGVEAFRAAWRGHPLMQLHTGDPAARALVDRMLARYRGEDLIHAAAQRPPTAGSEPLAQLRRPVLVVNGEFDTAERRDAGRRLCRELPGAEYAVIPGAGHLANLDNPRAYNDVVRAFIQRPSRVAA